ncbi:nucleotide-sugar transporter [Gregarina niphandrodes]|uniref:Nucleotide-sugar transporter n=1 Tax=Gregarina niphandrodes TaxID=110365 RepID=A0A023B5N4_GRENI|nr:nucleotide-sugar transporter [Gregarina niphandrodes]EZG60238.1 nucleotide-sugar transporter [Gregarina niphandrodes]|eukprot:XP_011130841.1 nucleotide-sugar transporter [Gregarina niphandrodes]
MSGLTDVEQMAARQVYVPVSFERRELARRTLLNNDVVKNLSRKELKEHQPFVDMLLFVVTVVVMGVSSIADQLAVMGSGSVKSIEYIPRMPYVLQYFLSTLVACVATGFFIDPRRIKEIFSLQGVVDCLPSLLAVAASDVINLRMQVQVDPGLWKVMSQTKLLFTVLFAKLFLGQTVTVTQWCSLTGISLTILAFSSRGLQEINIPSYYALVVVYLVMIANVAGGSHCEFKMKQRNAPFFIALGQNRFTGLLISATVVPFEITYAGQWSIFPFGNFHSGVWTMLCFDLLKCWLVIAVVKRLNSIFKTLAVSLAILVTYTISPLVLPNAPFSIIQLCMICAMATLILAYASARVDAEQLFEKEVLYAKPGNEPQDTASTQPPTPHNSRSPNRRSPNRRSPSGRNVSTRSPSRHRHTSHSPSSNVQQRDTRNQTQGRRSSDHSSYDQQSTDRSGSNTEDEEYLAQP